jgi:3-phenylpropionate/trans-cinnamate dioxygenase ferredoxin reductase subunit
MVIIGAGECGGRAAVTLREQGWTGAITLIGADEHPPYERPPLSKNFLTDEGSHTCRCNADAARFAELAIDHCRSRCALTIDRRSGTVHLDDSAIIPYHRLLLATGAQARMLAGAGGEAALTLRSHADAVRLRAHLTPGTRVIIIGGGFIGLELAASAVQRGCSVSVIELAPRLLSRNVPADLASLIEKRHRAAGVSIHIGVAVEKIEQGCKVILATGEVLTGDIVIAGIGAWPDTALAEQSGLAIDNGIATDAQLRTSDEAIFAAGDCAAAVHPLFGGRRLRLESWRNALEQGALAACNMLDQQLSQSAVPWFWSDQYELCLQIAGLPDMGTTIIARAVPDALLEFHLDATGRLVGASAFGPVGAIVKDIKIAELLIAKACRPDARALAEPAYKLKSLLAA